MMFNEYVNHSNQCSNYYQVVRKEEIQMQQTDTNRFKQKWLDVNQTYPQQQQYQMMNNPPPKPQQQQPQPPIPQQQQYNNYDYNRQSNTPSNQNYETFIPKPNERSITPTVQKQYYYQQNMQQQQPTQQQPAQQNRSYYQNGYEYNYEQNLAMSPAAKFNKKISSSSLSNNASHVDFNQAPTPSSSSTSSVLSPQPLTKVDSPKSWNTPVPTPMSVSQTTPPRNLQSSHSTSNITSLDLSQDLECTQNPKEIKEQSSMNTRSILSEININIDELFMYYPAVFEEIYYSLKLNSIEQIENDLRRYLEEHFKLNLSNNSNTPVNNNTNTNNSSNNSQPVSNSSQNMTGIRI
ncbi:unnamed protein product [Brachionus calyciflorus]|uniref:Uncharacterized protein n=1 Tax=Brachionus calyciflorus TaxID=104777 RepID=A0A813UUA3_9BILA|nr:unnamed protein product [Brachionus calyciflorus]